MKKLIITQNDANQRIDKYIKKLLVQAPSSFIYKMFRKKDIKVNNCKVDIDYILQCGDEVAMFLHEDKYLAYTREKTIDDIEITFTVLFEDEHILVVDKPVGLLIHKDHRESVNTLDNQVLLYLANKGEYSLSRENSFKPGPVHRLDRNTSGIVIFGKTMQATQVLNEMMKKRHCIEKKYKTIVVGNVEKEYYLENQVVKDEESNMVKIVSNKTVHSLTMKTIVTPLHSSKQYSEVLVSLITGRTHQIRVHCASMLHPVIGDRKYGDFSINKKIQEKTKLNHQLLHAYSIKFTKTFGVLTYLQDVEVFSPTSNFYENIKKTLL